MTNCVSIILPRETAIFLMSGPQINLYLFGLQISGLYTERKKGFSNRQGDISNKHIEMLDSIQFDWALIGTNMRFDRTIDPNSNDNDSHHLIKNDEKREIGGRIKTRTRICATCKKNTIWKCSHPYCESRRISIKGCVKTGSYFCKTAKVGTSKSCFQLHQENMAGMNPLI